MTNENNSASTLGVQGHHLSHTLPYPNPQATTQVSQAPKVQKRPQSLAPHYPELEQSSHRPQPGQNHFVNHMNPQPSMIWEHTLPVNFSNLAHNSMQMTQFLK